MRKVKEDFYLNSIILNISIKDLLKYNGIYNYKITYDTYYLSNVLNIYDDNNNLIYLEEEDFRHYEFYKYDERNNKIEFKNNSGLNIVYLNDLDGKPIYNCKNFGRCTAFKRDKKTNLIYKIFSPGYWVRYIFNDKNEKTYSYDSNGDGAEYYYENGVLVNTIKRKFG